MKSPIKWTGGKFKEIKYFKEFIPNFDIYVEPFFGGGAVYWYLQPIESVINDINPHLMNFYGVLRDNYQELSDMLQRMELTEDYFQFIVGKLNNIDYKNKIEQASIFYYLNKTSFSGKWRVNKKGKYNNTWGDYKRESFKVLDIKYSQILKDTKIFNSDYQIVMDEYRNNEDAFIFLDPPYLHCDTMYTTNQDFKPFYDYIYDFMKNCKCKVMLICKEDKYINDLFGEMIYSEYQVKYSHNSLSKVQNHHLVILNY